MKVLTTSRTQMMEAFFNHIADDKYDAESAGFEPGILNAFDVTAIA